ncbi:MAG: transporter substrate-binding domain-containing protein [SAR324 cluster bacterium]|nr:transporter substrate-binding domain-containing protein [SAR324 cluster bacterium]
MKLKCALIVITFLFSCSMLEAAKLKLGGTEWSPYIGSELKKHGIAAEVVSQIFRRAGHEVEFVFLPWIRTQRLVKTGELDGLAIAWFTEERAKTMVYSIPYINTAIVLIKRKDDPFVYNQIKDLEGKNIGVIRGYGYLKKIESEKIQKSVVKSLHQNLLKLAKGRIDLTMEEKLNAEKTIASMSEDIQNSITLIENPFEVKELHITLSKSTPNHKALLDDFNTVLISMVNDGSYQQMLDNLSPSPLSINQSKITELKKK